MGLLNFDIAIIANKYPGLNRYGGEFVHSRALYYAKSKSVIVLELNNSLKKEFKDRFQGIEVIRLPFKRLSSVLKKIKANQVAIHSVSEAVFSVALKHYRVEQIITWHHGAESLDLGRYYPFLVNEMSYEQWQQIKSSQFHKLSFIREILGDENLRNVFVSDWFLNTCSKDLDIGPKNVEIIHNGVDQAFFDCNREKEVGQPIKILVIKDFGFTKAADIAMEILCSLSKYKVFEKVEISIVGFGKFWSRWIRMVSSYKNVTVEKRYVSHNRLPNLFQSKDVLVNPTRHDTQGLLMCEAMAAGMLVVTNDVSAIKEFASKDDCVFSKSLHASSIASELARVLCNHDEMIRLKGKAKARMESQCSAQQTFHRELQFLGLLNQRML